jgi:uncharacterized protein with beta-barrel porin domain
MSNTNKLKFASAAVALAMGSASCSLEAGAVGQATTTGNVDASNVFSITGVDPATMDTSAGFTIAAGHTLRISTTLPVIAGGGAGAGDAAVFDAGQDLTMAAGAILDANEGIATSGTGDLVLTGAATIDVATGKTVTVGQDKTGAFGLTKAGAGALAVAGTYANALTATGGTTTLTGVVTGNITLNGTGVNVDTGTTMTGNAIVTEGTFTPGGAVTGDVTVAAGGVIDAALTLGNGGHTFSITGGTAAAVTGGTGGDTIDLNDGATVGAITAGGTGVSAITSDGAVTATSIAFGAADSLTVNTGTLTLTGATDFGNNAGTITLNGTLAMQSTLDLDDNNVTIGAGGDLTFSGNQAVTINGATITDNKGISLGSPITLEAATSIAPAADVTTTLTGAVSGAFALNHTGAGTLVVDGSVANNLQNTNGDLVIGGVVGGTVTNSGAGTGNVTVKTGASTGAVTASTSSQTYTIDGTIASYDGNGGTHTVNIGSGATVTGALDGNGAAHTMNIAGTVSGAITGDGASAIDIASTATIGSTVTANDTTTLSLGVAPTGLTTIANGDLTVAAGVDLTGGLTIGGTGKVNMGTGAKVSGTTSIGAVTTELTGEIKNLTFTGAGTAKLDGKVTDGSTLTFFAGSKLQLSGSSTGLDMSKVASYDPGTAAHTIELLDGASLYAGTPTAGNTTNLTIINASSNTLDLTTGPSDAGTPAFGGTVAAYTAQAQGRTIGGIDLVSGQRTHWLNLTGALTLTGTDTKLSVKAVRDDSIKDFTSTYTLFNTTGAVTGTFGTVELLNSRDEVAAGLTVTPAYTATTISATVTQKSIADYSTAIGASDNQKNFMTALKANWDAHNADSTKGSADFYKLDNMIRLQGASDASSALDQYGPEGYHMLNSGDIMQAQSFQEAMFDRTINMLPGGGPHKHAWVAPYATFMKDDAQDKFYSSEKKTVGVNLGADYHYKGDVFAGWAAGYAHSELDSDLGSKSSTEHYHVGGFAHKQMDNHMFYSGSASFSYNDHDAERHVSSVIGKTTELYKSTPDSYVIAADLSVGKHMYGKSFNLTPYFKLSGLYHDIDAFNETGSTSADVHALKLKKHDKFHGYAIIGMNADMAKDKLLDGNFSMKPQFKLAYRGEVSKLDRQYWNAYLSDAAVDSFKFGGAPLGRHTIQLGMKLSGLGLAKQVKGHYFDAGYDVNVRDHGNLEHKFGIKYEIKW